MPRNTLFAHVFYYGELLEKWGTGTSRMITLCRNHGIPGPEFSAYPDWLSVTFATDFSTDEQLLALGLSDRQVKAVRYVREHGRITNTGYHEVAEVLKRESSRDLKELVEKGVFVQVRQYREGHIRKIPADQKERCPVTIEKIRTLRIARKVRATEGSSRLPGRMRGRYTSPEKGSFGDRPNGALKMPGLTIFPAF